MDQILAYDLLPDELEGFSHLWVKVCQCRHLRPKLQWKLRLKLKLKKKNQEGEDSPEEPERRYAQRIHTAPKRLDL